MVCGLRTAKEDKPDMSRQTGFSGSSGWIRIRITAWQNWVEGGFDLMVYRNGGGRVVGGALGLEGHGGSIDTPSSIS